MKTEFPKRVFVTGIGTGVGKTVVATVLAEALHADYWKPVQTGDATGNNDSDFVKSLLHDKSLKVHNEAYRFALASSPHYAAQQEGVTIDIQRILLPPTNNRIVIEGAGGLLVPLNEKELMADLIMLLNVPIVIVVNNYLGSVNHTLLTLEVIQKRNLNVCGIIFNGDNFMDNEEIIQKYTSVPVLGKVNSLKEVTRDSIVPEAINLRQSLLNQFDF